MASDRLHSSVAIEEAIDAAMGLTLPELYEFQVWLNSKISERRR